MLWVVLPFVSAGPANATSSAHTAQPTNATSSAYPSSTAYTTYASSAADAASTANASARGLLRRAVAAAVDPVSAVNVCVAVEVIV